MPVPKGATGRVEGDSVLYNQAAREVLENFPGIVINDLYGFTVANMKKWAIKPDNVHFNELGKEEQGKAVSRVIAENL